MIRLICAVALAAACVTTASAQDPSAGKAKVTLVHDQVIPNVPGKSLRAVLVEYGPGGSSPAHTHALSAFIFVTVLEGRVRSQIDGGPATLFEVGQSFVELPGGHHLVSANASTTAPSKHLAVFVVDTEETNLTIPDPN